MRRPSPAFVVACLALLVALGGVASGAIPGAGGVINACYNQANGALSVREENEACEPDAERSISWNQQGQQGPAGPPGPPGAPGGSRPVPDVLSAAESAVRNLSRAEREAVRARQARDRDRSPRAVAVGGGGIRLFKAHVGHLGRNLSGRGPDSPVQIQLNAGSPDAAAEFFLGQRDWSVVTVYFAAPVVGCTPIVGTSSWYDTNPKILSVGGTHTAWNRYLRDRDRDALRRVIVDTDTTRVLDRSGTEHASNLPFTLVVICDPRDRPPAATPVLPNPPEARPAGQGP